MPCLFFCLISVYHSVSRSAKSREWISSCKAPLAQSVSGSSWRRGHHLEHEAEEVPNPCPGSISVETHRSNMSHRYVQEKSAEFASVQLHDMWTFTCQHEPHLFPLFRSHPLRHRHYCGCSAAWEAFGTRQQHPSSTRGPQPTTQASPAARTSCADPCQRRKNQFMQYVFLCLWKSLNICAHSLRTLSVPTFFEKSVHGQSRCLIRFQPQHVESWSIKGWYSGIEVETRRIEGDRKGAQVEKHVEGGACHPAFSGAISSEQYL